MFDLLVLRGGILRAVVVAQLVEWLLPTPEIRGPNMFIFKIYLPIAK